MNEIVQLVAQKFNLSPETAQQIVDFVVAQVKGKAAREPVATRRWPLAGGAESGGLLDKVKEMAGGLLNKA